MQNLENGTKIIKFCSKKPQKACKKPLFLMHFPLFAVISAVRKFSLKTSIGGGILAKRRINLNETASR